MKVKGVLFDYDGVLVDSIPDHARAWQRAMKDLGVNITLEDYYPLEGTRIIDIAKLFCSQHGLDSSLADEIVKKKKQYYKQDHTIAFYPGINEFLDFLISQGIKIGMVTASHGPMIRQTVPHDFLDKFDFIVSGDMWKKGKPHPEPYLSGLEEIGLEASECVVVENAILGVQSAKKAGIYCFAITTTLKRYQLHEADEVVDTFNELQERISSMI